MDARDFVVCLSSECREYSKLKMRLKESSLENRGNDELSHTKLGRKFFSDRALII